MIFKLWDDLLYSKSFQKLLKLLKKENMFKFDTYIYIYIYRVLIFMCELFIYCTAKLWLLRAKRSMNEPLTPNNNNKLLTITIHYRLYHTYQYGASLSNFFILINILFWFNHMFHFFTHLLIIFLIKKPIKLFFSPNWDLVKRVYNICFEINSWYK